MMSEYKSQLLHFLKSKKYMISVIITFILSFGFTITHESMGIDDISFDRYLDGGMYWLSQNRYGMWIIYNILNIKAFTPFWLDFMTAILIVVISLTLCLFVRKNFSKIIKSDWVYVVFSCILISSPIINFYYTYQVSSLSVTISNLVCIILGIIVYENYFNKNIQNKQAKNNKQNKLTKIKLTKNFSLIILVGLALSVAISTYESCAQTYLVFLFLSMFLKSASNNADMLKKDINRKVEIIKEDKNKLKKIKSRKIKINKNTEEKEKNKELIRYLLVNVAIMIIGLIGYYLVNKLIHIILLQSGKLVADYSSTKIIWLDKKISETKGIIKFYLILKFFKDFGVIIKDSLPIAIFVSFLIIALIIELIHLLKTSNSLRTLSFLGIILSNFIIPILQLEIVHRTLFSLIITIAILGAYIYNYFCTKKNLKYVVNVLTILLVLHQTKLLNDFFVNDYKRYEREKLIANNIAVEIVNNYDYENKPLIFYIEKPTEVQQKYGRIHRENSVSIIWWGISAFAKPQEEAIKFVNYFGYSFKFPTEEQVENANLEYGKLEEDKKKSIVEFDDYIVVNLEKYDFFKEYKG